MSTISQLHGDNGAIFSNCMKYRYRLWRAWDKNRPSMCFIMLNPSTADAWKNDNTVERCERRAKLWGYGRLDIVNIFAYRSIDPAALKQVENPEGDPHNDGHIFYAARQARLVLCAWGKHGLLNNRQIAVLRLLRDFSIEPMCLKINGDGTPAHPLYLSYSVTPISYK